MCFQLPPSIQTQRIECSCSNWPQCESLTIGPVLDNKIGGLTASMWSANNACRVLHRPREQQCGVICLSSLQSSLPIFKMELQTASWLAVAPFSFMAPALLEEKGIPSSSKPRLPSLLPVSWPSLTHGEEWREPVLQSRGLRLWASLGSFLCSF